MSSVLTRLTVGFALAAAPCVILAQQPTFKAGAQIVPLYITVLDATKRLVPDLQRALRQASRDGEIRLTYGELTALIADAVKNLRE